MPLDVSRLAQLPKPFILCTVTAAQGSAPGKPGFRMAVFPDGRAEGTIGGGDIERAAIEMAQELLKSGAPHQTQEFLLHQPAPGKKTKGSAKTSMICGGTATVFFERFQQQPRVVLFGGGHIAQSLAPLVAGLGYEVEVCDNRRTYATADKFPAATRIRIGAYEKLGTQTELTPSTFCVILTHGHTHDYAVLKTLLQRADRPAYVGMIGSRVKVAQMLQRLVTETKSTELKITRARTRDVYAPIGLEIGGDTPAEIALAIAAEIQAVRYGKPAPHLRERR